MRRDSDEYEKRGLKRLGVAVQKRARLAAWLRNHPLPFPMLADESRTAARTYGVYVELNFESLRIARPATFVIDPSGIIRFIHVGIHQFDRPPVSEVLAITDQFPRGRDSNFSDPAPRDGAPP